MIAKNILNNLQKVTIQQKNPNDLGSVKKGLKMIMLPKEIQAMLRAIAKRHGAGISKYTEGILGEDRYQ